MALKLTDLKTEVQGYIAVYKAEHEYAFGGAASLV